MRVAARAEGRGSIAEGKFRGSVVEATFIYIYIYIHKNTDIIHTKKIDIDTDIIRYRYRYRYRYSSTRGFCLTRQTKSVSGFSRKPRGSLAEASWKPKFSNLYLGLFLFKTSSD